MISGLSRTTESIIKKKKIWDEDLSHQTEHSFLRLIIINVFHTRWWDVMKSRNLGWSNWPLNGFLNFWMGENPSTQPQNALVLVKMPSFNEIGWKLAMILLRKFVERTIQTSVKFRDFAHAFNASPYNFASFLILRHSFQQCQRIFTNRRRASPRMTRHIREL